MRIKRVKKAEEGRRRSLGQHSCQEIVQAWRNRPGNIVMLGYEWNVPGHDHASVGIVGAAKEGGLAIALHKYLIDDKGRGTTPVLSGHCRQRDGKGTGRQHAKAEPGIK